MSDKLVKFKLSADAKPYRLESELATKVDVLIHEYDDLISAVAVIGILDLIKADILSQITN